MLENRKYLGVLYRQCLSISKWNYFTWICHSDLPSHLIFCILNPYDTLHLKHFLVASLHLFGIIEIKVLFSTWYNDKIFPNFTIKPEVFIMKWYLFVPLEHALKMSMVYLLEYYIISPILLTNLKYFLSVLPEPQPVTIRNVC